MTTIHTKKNQRTSTRGSLSSFARAIALCFSLLVSITATAHTNQPGRGMTAPFEVDYLTFLINHHSAGLRMSELAAGTDAIRDAVTSTNEGTTPTPGFNPTPAKSTREEITSLARQNNRVHREQILTAQRLLRDLYGLQVQAQISPVNQARINELEAAPAGDAFDHLFLEIFARHHYVITARSLEAVTSSDLDHRELERLARTILETEMNEINDMRDLLLRFFNIADFQPYTGFKGRHAGDDAELERQFVPFNEVTQDEDEDGNLHPATTADLPQDGSTQGSVTNTVTVPTTPGLQPGPILPPGGRQLNQ